MTYIEVTDKKYRMDAYLVDNLDECIGRQSRKWDNLLIIDGKEGSGKSTLAFQIAYYWAWKTGKEFTTKNVFFDSKELLKFAAETTNQIIVWDEAAIGALSKNWQSKTQQNLIINLMINRKKGHFWIFNIPQILELNRYVAIHRAFFLIHVYSEDRINRGDFKVFGEQKIQRLYIEGKRQGYPAYNKPNYVGHFTNDSVIDMEDYENKKDKVILSFAQGEVEKEDESAKYKHLYATFSNFTDNIRIKDLADHAKVSERTILRWKNLEVSSKNADGDTMTN